jgi:hypothetical protein
VFFFGAEPPPRYAAARMLSISIPDSGCASRSLICALHMTRRVVRKGSLRRFATGFFSETELSHEAGPPSKGFGPVVTSAVHDRMPVILDPDAFELWFAPGLRDAAASDLLMPHAARLMRAQHHPSTIGGRGLITGSWQCSLRTCLSMARAAWVRRLPNVSSN